MEDVARAAGLAKGTLYLYVASKEALFGLALRHADGERPIPSPPQLPVAAPRPGATLRAVEERLVEERRLPLLSKALAGRPQRNARAELEATVRELYRTLARNRTRIKLVDRCAHDYPELAAIWFGGGRHGVLRLLERFLESRIRARKLVAVRDVAAAARFLLETVVFWAVHRHWDPAPQPVDERIAEDLVVELLANAFVGGASR